jgi:hypothetical protein
VAQTQLAQKWKIRRESIEQYGQQWDALRHLP